MVKSNAKKKIVLVDFSCSNYFTHHASYLKAYADFAADSGYEVEIWINNAATSEVKTYLRTYSLKPILDSPDYGNTIYSNINRYLRDRVFGLCLKLIDSFRIKNFSNFVREKCARLYFSTAFSEILRLEKSSKDCLVIFPSIDGIGIRFLKYCLDFQFDSLTFSARVLNSQTRGLLGVENALTDLSDIVAKDKDLRIMVGYETDSVRNQFSELIPPNQLLWAPIPPRNLVPTRNYGQPYVLGFIGSARENKGFDNIPAILEKLVDCKVEFKALIQLANFEWPSYRDTYNKLIDRFYNQVTFLPGACSEDALQNALQNIDFLILPYKLENYRFAGSGLLYQAADLNVPILASAGVGFEWDIIEFSIGDVFQDFEVLPQLISHSKFRNNYLSPAFKKYSDARAQATRNFLRFSE